MNLGLSYLLLFGRVVIAMRSLGSRRGSDWLIAF